MIVSLKILQSLKVTLTLGHRSLRATRQTGGLVDCIEPSCEYCHQKTHDASG